MPSILFYSRAVHQDALLLQGNVEIQDAMSWSIEVIVKGASYHYEADVAMNCVVTEDDILDVQVVSRRLVTVESFFCGRISSFLWGPTLWRVT